MPNRCMALILFIFTNGGVSLKKTIDNLSINYKIQGNGEFVFLLHGWGSNLKVYDALSNVISEKYTVVSLDFPGFGDSDEPSEVWDVSAYSDFLVKFIESFGCKNVILLGHSFGGRVIIKLANLGSLPFDIQKIILVDSAGVLPKRTLKYKIKNKAYKLGRMILSIGIIKKMFPDTLDNYRKKMGSADYNNASLKMRGILVKTVNEDLTPILKNIKIPTLLIWGELDTATPLSDGQLMEKNIEGAGLVVLKGAGHYSFLDQQYTFHRVIRSFLKIGE